MNMEKGKGMTRRTRNLFAVLLLWLLAGVAANATDTVTYIYADPQGTPLAEADASGNITATFDYTPYGTTALGTSPNGPGYTGHVNDPETNLVYMQARYYDPAVGSFLSVDSVSLEVGNTFSFNRFEYANGNPIRNTDPTGKCPDKNPCAEPTPYNFFRDNPVGSILGHVAGDPIAIFTQNNYNPISNVYLDQGQVQDAKLGVVTNLLSAITTPELFGGKSTLTTLEKAAVNERDALVESLKSSKWKPATATGGYNTQTGEIVAKVCGGGKCAEDHVVQALGGDKTKVRFTQAIRPRTGEQVPVCARCEENYGRDAFPPGTEFQSDK
jgi:RHS repeat-associated protein